MKIGITGGIASGKSIVSQYLKDKGYIVIESDNISHQLLKREDIKKRVCDEFMLQLTNNEIDRQQLGNIVFHNPEKLRKLENIVHPEIISEIKKQMENKKIVFVDAPILYELHLEQLFDKIIVVYVPKNIQIERLVKRNNINFDEARNRINHQIDIEKKILIADYVIDNSLDINNTYQQIEKFLEQEEIK